MTVAGQCYNFDSFSHQQLYDMIHGISIVEDKGCFAVPGDKGASEAVWREFNSLMQSVQAQVSTALAAAGVGWSGAAAEAAQGGIMPLAQWASDAGMAGGQVHSSLGTQNNSYTTAKTSMPEPQQVTSTANSDYWGIPAGFEHLVGGQTDQDAQEQKANEAKAQAVHVMNTYQASSQAATSNLGTWTPPPSVTVDVPPPSPQQGPGVGPTSGRPSVSGGGTAGSGGSRVTGGSGGGSWVPPGGGGGPIAPPSGPPQTTDPSQYQPPTFHPGPIGRPLPPGAVPPGGSQPSPIGGPVFGPIGGPGGAGGGAEGENLGRGGRLGPRGSGLASEEFGSRGSQQPGRGPASGAGAVAGEEGPFGRGAAGARGPAGASGMGGPLGGAGSRKEEDREHKRAAYLQEVDDVWEGGIQKVAPPVIGAEE
ncbi:PPE domain-containing protein [Gandjariella thermophila]|uniref:PPE domain-containing protein n=1 Tax=Gandjariella thermophila TaxID=1931992 RepID=A0A4D4JG20_9PSEU|nr:PPE domain-containing protein [Gandjariella thermophila]GDY33960.1 hypothetical protein GTS_55930 [Gandjariella thermophila]